MDEGDYAKSFADRWVAECLAEHRVRTGTGDEVPGTGTSHCPSQVPGSQSPICIDCGDPISPARLAAQPGAVRCIECQRDFEMNSRRKN